MVYIKYHYNLHLKQFCQTYQKMNSTTLQIVPQKAAYQIPLQETHPIMTELIVATYEKVLSYSGLKLNQQIGYRNVRINENQFMHQIFTKGHSGLPHLVFLHGYGGTSMTAIRLFQHLHKQFQVHALDAFGIGFSSRGKYTEQFTYEQTRDYYVEAVEDWRKAMNIEKFYLVGHSFGGYLAACYAFKYPNRVMQLFLVSPAGTNDRLELQRGEDIPFKRRMFLCLAEKIYNWNIRPSRAMTNFFIGNKIVNSILTNRLGIPEEQQQDWRQYLNYVNSQDTSSETGFYKLFGWPLNPKITIQQMIRENKVPFEIDFYFGDSDWMPRDGAKRLVNQNFKNVKLKTISHAGHQIVFDNSPQLCYNILLDSLKK